MFEFFNFARKRRLNYDQLQTLQMVAQQVVLSLDGSVKIPGAAKKALALKFVGELLEQLDIVAPDSLIDVSIEAAVKLLRVLDTQTLPPQPTPEPGSGKRQAIKLPSVSGRPPTGNSMKGLSL
jgi:hypothetical protein